MPDRKQQLNFSGGNASLNFAPIQSPELGPRNKRAEAVLRRLKRQEKNKEQPHSKYKNVATERTLKAGGLQSSATRLKGKGVPSVKGSDLHNLEFSRDTFEPGDSYEPRKNLSPKNAKLRQDNIKYQMGQLMDEVKTGDIIEAQPIESESGRNPRARMYDRMTKGALKSSDRQLTKNYSMKEVKAARGQGNDWINPANKGKVVKFDPKSLKKPLQDATVRAITKRFAHPVIQGAMMLDDASAAVTDGKKVSGIAKELFDKHAKPAILKRLKKGMRVTPVSPLPYSR